MSQANDRRKIIIFGKNMLRRILLIYFFAEHFITFGLLNQLVTLSHQLNYDAFNRANHKYMAHQLALLYVSKIL